MDSINQEYDYWYFVYEGSDFAGGLMREENMVRVTKGHPFPITVCRDNCKKDHGHANGMILFFKESVESEFDTFLEGSTIRGLT